jgi:ubiquinone biosynthesis protein
VISIIETVYGQKLAEVFAEFSPTPLASASVAQVHTAKLPTGETVVVKVVRPNIRKTIQQDIRLLYTISKLVMHFYTDGKRFRPDEVVGEFERTILSELDMRNEAASAAQLRHNFHDSTIIMVPKVYFSYTHAEVLVMERVYGTKVSDVETLRAWNVNLEKLARNGVEIFMTQVFRDRFFHADMHPGNVLVDHTDPQNPKYCAIDFGIMGTLTENDQYYLAKNFLAFFHRDYESIARLHVDSQWVDSQTNIEEFTAAIRTVCEPIFEKPLSEISFGQLLLQLFQTARRFNMQVQPQLILLQKTLLNIEGLGRQLYPQLNLFETVKPFLENWAKERYSIKNLWRKLRDNSSIWLERLPQMPELFYQYLKQPTIAKQAVVEKNGLLKKIRNLYKLNVVLCVFCLAAIVLLLLK